MQKVESSSLFTRSPKGPGPGAFLVLASQEQADDGERNDRH